MGQDRRFGVFGEEGSWLDILVSVIEGMESSSKSVEEVVTAVANRLGVSPRRVAAAIAGMEAVAEYQFSEMDEDGDAIE